MIFKQVDKILSGTKTQARWVVKPNHKALAPSLADIQQDTGRALRVWIETCDPPDFVPVHGRVVYEVGRTYAVAPAPGRPGVWWIENWADGTATPDGTYSWLPVHSKNRTQFAAIGYKPARIRITAIRREALQSISEADARAEGVKSVEAYRVLWDSINGKTRGARWADNPDVWVLTFEVVKEGAP